MLNTKDLDQKKATAREAYKEARSAFMATCTRENIKGDFEKFKAFKEAERACRMLGCII